MNVVACIANKEVLQSYCTFAQEVTLASRRDLGEAFFTKAQGLLDLEAGRPSLPTAQALLGMFSYSCCMGRDRAGILFHAAGCEMTERMMQKKKRAMSSVAHSTNSRRAISRAIWGMFCFDRLAR